MSELHTYSVYSVQGKFIKKVEAKTVVDAAMRLGGCWPCILRATHLPYKFVVCDEGGTLDFTEGRVKILSTLMTQNL